MVTKSETQDRLLAGAAELFRRKGYSATTTRELSALLGIQNASLYYHMERKEDLLYEICRTTLDDVSRELRAGLAEATDPLERLRRLMQRYVTSALLERDRHATMLMEIRSLSEERRSHIVDLRDANVKTVRQAIKAAQQAGQIRKDIPAKYLTLAMFNILNWTIFWYRPDGLMTPEQIGDTLCSVFLFGVANRQDAVAEAPGPVNRRSRRQSLVRH